MQHHASSVARRGRRAVWCVVAATKNNNNSWGQLTDVIMCGGWEGWGFRPDVICLRRRIRLVRLCVVVA